MANYFRLEFGADNIAVLTLDIPDSKVNTLGTGVIRELAEHVTQLETKKDIRGLLFRSEKPGQFIAGADLNEIASLAFLTQEQAERGVTMGHSLFGRIAELPYPTVALIDGASMGGGTELALAFDYRICSTNPKTQIALPEVKIGVIPGWGGTQRLPRLIGVPNALEMICTGEGAGPEKARSLGIVFDAVPVEKMEEEARRLLKLAIKSGDWQEDRKRRSQPVGMSEDQFQFAFGVAEGQVREKTKGQFPAPLLALRAVKEGCNVPLEEGLKCEKKAFCELAGSTIAGNLIAIFFMNNRLERDKGIEDKSIQPRPVGKVGVLGAGLMGSGIATANARSKIPTVMVDMKEEFVASGLARARGVVEGRIKIGRATPNDLADLLSKLTTGTSHGLFSDCDVVVEAITENEKLKAETYKQLAPDLKEGAILASNTSTISITRLGEYAPSAERFAGMHFFNPVDRMQLVEVIRGEKTSDETVSTLVALAKKLKKTPIVVRDCAGFLVNRVLFPYMNEAAVLLIEGADMDAIDKAATSFGMPMGPILLHDVVGLDTCWFAGNVLHEAYKDRALAVPLVGDLVKAGRMGQKSGAGFRKFDGKSPKGVADPDFEPILAKHRKSTRTFTQEEIIDRLFLPMLFEASRCVEEKIVRDPADVDMGLIMGIGFPTFRGGILRWCDAEGAQNIVKRAEKYKSLGKRYEPTEIILQQAKSPENKFFPRPKSIVPFGG